MLGFVPAEESFKHSGSSERQKNKNPSNVFVSLPADRLDKGSPENQVGNLEEEERHVMLDPCLSTLNYAKCDDKEENHSGCA